ncbi:DUF2470 domain-containing protein [Microlunatus capsulatus]|uniref:DUF2470 domain-containing protein n=1 Tax=Microlunatus capsulatus TaxID=99117 RepID=A0ABS4Z725_9ACTN|nr:DUF2470 domain-containing protein [Microlunatus capsulatus]MBP2416794.1 hypothetical protein [Microlunatus capsulatus]
MAWTPTPTPAEQARTVLALGGPAGWRLEPSGEVLVAPFVAAGGTPLLLVERERTDDLLGQHGVAVTLAPGLGLATVTLVGRPRPPRPHELVGELRAYRHEHAGCGPACGTAGLPVALELVRVQVVPAGERDAVPVAVADLQAARPLDGVLAGYDVARHLNADHTAELLRLAADVTGRDPGELVAAQVAAVSADGVRLTLIDGLGVTELDVVFALPARTPAELGRELHRLLADPSTHPLD